MQVDDSANKMGFFFPDKARIRDPCSFFQRVDLLTTYLR